MSQKQLKRMRKSIKQTDYKYEIKMKTYKIMKKLYNENGLKKTAASKELTQPPEEEK